MPARKFGPSGLKYENTEMVLQKNGTNEQQEEGKAIIQYIVNEVSASALVCFTGGSCLPNPGPCGAGAVIYHR